MNIKQLKDSIDIILERNEVDKNAEVVFVSDGDYEYDIHCMYHITDIENNKDKIILSQDEIYLLS